MFVSDNIDLELIKLLEHIESMNVYQDGKMEHFRINELKFSTFIGKFVDIFRRARVMPAFGVSLHDDTMNALQYGEWIEINFDQELAINGLPFDSLLFRVEKTTGVNLIRKYQDKYDGRAIYIDFDEEIDFTELFNFLLV